VHLVTGELDAGPIVLQRAVAVLERRHDAKTLSVRILEQEHLAYPEAVGPSSMAVWKVKAGAMCAYECRPRGVPASVMSATSGGQLILTGRRPFRCRDSRRSTCCPCRPSPWILETVAFATAPTPGSTTWPAVGVPERTAGSFNCAASVRRRGSWASSRTVSLEFFTAAFVDL
jgi:hypothetical protein